MTTEALRRMERYVQPLLSGRGWKVPVDSIAIFRTIVFATLVTAHLWEGLGPVAAQEFEEDFQTWGVVYATGSFAPIDQRWNRFRYSMEAQGRFGNNSSRFSQGVVRPALGYALNARHSVWLGGDWLPTSPPFTFRDDFNEYRSWQQWLWSDEFTFGSVISRSRFEQRFFDIPDTEDVGYRYRQLLKVSIPLPMISPDINLILADEIFVNLTHADATFIRQGFDQNRVIVGFSYRVNRTTVVEIGYLNQYLSRKNTPRPDQMQHILLTTILFDYLLDGRLPAGRFDRTSRSGR